MQTEHTKPPQKWWITRVNHLILKNLSDFYLTNTKLAQKLSVSERQLYRIVREQTGMSPNVYIRQIRLQEAYQLLQSEDSLLIKEVAAKVGFQKTNYFTRLFKSAFGLTPLEVLRQNQTK